MSEYGESPALSCVILACMAIDFDACFAAVCTRDRRFDGRFFVGIASTGSYCRPICPARTPGRDSMRFFSSAAAAEGAGFRPCLRCRPERAPGVGAVDAMSRLACAAIAGIEEHACSGERLGALAALLGVSERHLRRVTDAELGVSPIELAQTQRLLLARRLLRETTLDQTEIAFASGFGSLRRFNALFKSRYGTSPRQLRGSPVDASRLTCRLEFRPPLAWKALLAYLRLRAIPQVEWVDSTHYRRTVRIGAHRGWLAVSLAADGAALDIELARALAPVIGGVLARVKRLCDLDSMPDAVAARLSTDPTLAPSVARLPGLRVPGSFDGFELAVRAVLGQQISVRAATTLAGRWAGAFGEEIATPYPLLSRLTPTAERTAASCEDDIARLGIVGSRARCILGLSRAIAAGHVMLSGSADVEVQTQELLRLPGIGPWTAQYIAMRALRWPDAFPATDLMLRRAAQATARELVARAEAWRPWRAYATHYLWQSLGVAP